MTGLLLDYGGVLTGPVRASFTAFEAANAIPVGRTLELVLAASRAPDGGLIGALERGELAPEAFERELATRYAAAGHTLAPGTLVDGLFAALRPAGRLWYVAAEARAAGIPTGLLSNSWGTGFYPWERLAAHFDVQVISGEVGLRKPDPAIYHLAVERLGVPAEACVFVDDLPRNVAAATALGMAGITHDGDDVAVADTVGRLLDLDPGPDGWQPVVSG